MSAQCAVCGRPAGDAADLVHLRELAARQADDAAEVDLCLDCLTPREAAFWPGGETPTPRLLDALQSTAVDRARYAYLQDAHSGAVHLVRVRHDCLAQPHQTPPGP